MSGELVLVAMDDPFDLRTLSEVGEAAGYQVVAAADGDQALTIVARDRPAVAILDVRLSGTDGLEVLRVLKADHAFGALPVLMVVDVEDEASRERGMALGADDWVVRPFRVFEVQQRIRNALRVRRAEARAEEAERSSDLDLVDPVTQAGTETQLGVTLDYEFTRAARFRHPLSCVVVEARGVEAFAEGEGRAAADALLVRFAQGLRGCIRGIDHLFRTGPGRFSMVLPETGDEGAAVVLGRIRQSHGNGALWGAGPRPPTLTLATGAATYPDTSAPSGHQLHLTAVTRLAAPD
jgi:PleD family two-component response regulator